MKVSLFCLKRGFVGNSLAYGDVVQRVLSRPLATKLSHGSSEGVTREEDRCKLSDSSNFQLYGKMQIVVGNE
ncbi:hypothetical protein IAS59_005731 [Cryptococcus gattii]